MAQPAAFAMAWTIVARTATDQWRLAVSILACSTLGAMIQLPDLGPVPVGLFSKVHSGWCSAGVCCYIAIGYTSVIPALVLAVLLGVSAVRQRLSWLGLNSGRWH